MKYKGFTIIQALRYIQGVKTEEGEERKGKRRVRKKFREKKSGEKGREKRTERGGGGKGRREDPWLVIPSILLGII